MRGHSSQHSVDTIYDERVYEKRVRSRHLEMAITAPGIIDESLWHLRLACAVPASDTRSPDVLTYPFASMARKAHILLIGIDKRKSFV